MKLYTTPPYILTLMTWEPQIRLAFSHSAHRLAFSQTESYSVQPRLLLAATIESPARILDGRARLYSSKLSYSAVVINI